jgi:hypothetical protein
MLCGDFLANSAGVERLEARLMGSRPDYATITACTFEEFGRPEAFILGLGELSAIAEAIARGLGGGHGGT